jgi:hypothetical protein
VYSLVLLAAMTGAGEAPGAYYNAFTPCYPCEDAWFSRGGTVIFFWAGPAALSPAEEKEWQDYLALLDDGDRAAAADVWGMADRSGKYKLLAQVRAMRPKDAAPDKKPD